MLWRLWSMHRAYPNANWEGSSYGDDSVPHMLRRYSFLSLNNLCYIKTAVYNSVVHGHRWAWVLLQQSYRASRWDPWGQIYLHSIPRPHPSAQRCICSKPTSSVADWTNMFEYEPLVLLRTSRAEATFTSSAHTTINLSLLGESCQVIRRPIHHSLRVPYIHATPTADF